MLHHYNIFMDSRHVDNNSTNKLKEKQFHLFNVHAMILIQCWSFKLFNLIFKSFLNYFKGFVLVRNQIVPVNQFNCNLVKHISKMVLRKDEAVLIWTVSKIETFFLFIFFALHRSSYVCLTKSHDNKDKKPVPIFLKIYWIYSCSRCSAKLKHKHEKTRQLCIFMIKSDKDVVHFVTKLAFTWS